MSDLDKLSELSVGTCVKSVLFGSIKTAQIPVFSDASQGGYGGVVYVLLKNQDGEKQVSFLTGKSRVVPLKEMTIL